MHLKCAFIKMRINTSLTLTHVVSGGEREREDTKRSTSWANTRTLEFTPIEKGLSSWSSARILNTQTERMFVQIAIMIVSRNQNFAWVKLFQKMSKTDSTKKRQGERMKSTKKSEKKVQKNDKDLRVKKKRNFRIKIVKADAFKNKLPYAQTWIFFTSLFLSKQIWFWINFLCCVCVRACSLFMTWGLRAEMSCLFFIKTYISFWHFS